MSVVRGGAVAVVQCSCEYTLPLLCMLVTTGVSVSWQVRSEPEAAFSVPPLMVHCVSRKYSTTAPVQESAI